MSAEAKLQKLKQFLIDIENKIREARQNLKGEEAHG